MANWNFYSGTKTFVTDTFLWFQNDSLNDKYIAENRGSYTLRMLIWVSSFITLGYQLIYDFENIGVSLLVSLIMHVASYHSWRRKKDFLKSRVCMEIPMLYYHILCSNGWMNTPSLIALLPWLIFDLISLCTWKLHLWANLIHLLLMNVIVFIFGNPNLMNSKSVLIPSTKIDFIILVIVLILDIVLFATFEKLMKENWVLKKSFEKSFKKAVSIIDTNPHAVLICDNKGSILFSNQKFLSSTPVKSEKDYQSRLIASIQEGTRTAFLKEVAKVCTDNTPIKTIVSMATSTPDEFAK